jgi:hypothetical protein
LATFAAILGAFTIQQYPLIHSAILDSGTTLHIFNQISRFVNLRKPMPGEFVWAGTIKVPILAYGEVDIRVTTRGGASRLIRLYDVAYCEKMACNLVSLKRLRERGMIWDLRSSPSELQSIDGSAVCILQEIHDQFVIEHIPQDLGRAAFYARRNAYNSHTHRKPRGVDAETWHLRMGHPGPKALEHLVNSAQGVRIRGPTAIECAACAQAKIKRQVKRKPRERPKKAGMRLAIDFHDWHPDDEKYTSLMLITDRYSGYMWDFYLQDREAASVLHCLRGLLKHLDVQYNIRPQVIECDGEMTKAAAYKAFSTEMGFIWEPSAPRTQSQNGGAERSGGVFKEKVRAMGLGAAFPVKLWREMSKTAIYLLNRQPREWIDWKTPYQEFFTKLRGFRKPYTGHLRAFGCKAYAMTADAQLKENRLNRFAPKAWIGYLIGYASTNIYRVWIPSQGKVINTRDVIFNENDVLDGTFEQVAESIREVDLEALAQRLQEIAIPDPEEELVYPGLEDPNNVRDLDDDPREESVGSLQKASINHENEAVGSPPEASMNHANEEGQGKYTDARFEPFPTPPASPPAAMLAGAIRGDTPPLHQAGKLDCGSHWNGAFHAGTRSSVIGTLNKRTLTRAQLERRLATPLSIHRNELPPPPKNHGELKYHPLGLLYQNAEKLHLASHKERNSWFEVIARGVKGKILDCMWVYTYKFDKHHRLQKVKARLVVRGDQQPRSLTESNYAATLAGRSFRTIMAIAARFDMELLQYDAVNAFVNANLDEDIYMRMPPGHKKPGTVLKLNKALYGLRRSPILWQRTLTSALKKIGYAAVPHEPCAFTKNGVIIFFYVDDIVVCFKEKQRKEALADMEQLKQRFQLTGGDPLRWFLGIEVLRDRPQRRLWLSQCAYLKKIALLAESTPQAQTPMGREELLPATEVADFTSIRRYMRKVGSIMYAAVITRPDVAFAVSRLSRFSTNPSSAHQCAADRVLRYLLNTYTLALEYGGDDDFRCASDASFGDNTLDRKSSQAYAMRLFGGMIGWRANKQATVTTSTTEAELLALSQTAKEAMYVGRLIKELGVRLDDHHIRVECDNTNTIRIVTDEISQLKTNLRHVDIHNHWLRQEVQNGTITVQYTKSAEMIADGLTKALQNNTFDDFRQQMNLQDVGTLLAERPKEKEVEHPDFDFED